MRLPPDPGLRACQNRTAPRCSPAVTGACRIRINRINIHKINNTRKINFHRISTHQTSAHKISTHSTWHRHRHRRTTTNLPRPSAATRALS
jgi:hypothetical protein